MAVIDSRTAGALKPISQSVSVGDITNTVRKWISDLTGIDIKLVRKRYTQRVGIQPPIETDWVSVGVLDITTHGTPEQVGTKGDIQTPESGDATKISHQTIKMVASFYGANALMNADLFRESAQVSQNVDYLRSLNGLSLTLQGVSDQIRHLPDFAHEQWIERYEVEFNLGRKVERTFGIRTIASTEFEIITEKGKL